MRLTDEYKEQQKELHESNKNYGTSSFIYKSHILGVIDFFKPKNVLDYGCGKGLSKQFIDTPLTLYDPCIKGLDSDPDSADLVICTDVLEHIEPECLDDVLDHLQKLTDLAGFFSIHTGPAIKILSDGRNAHLIQQEYNWWLPKIWSRFDLVSYGRGGGGFYVIVTKRGLNGFR